MLLDAEKRQYSIDIYDKVKSKFIQLSVQHQDFLSAFPCGEPAIILQAESNEEVDLPVGHIHDRLDTFFGSTRKIVTVQENRLH